MLDGYLAMDSVDHEWLYRSTENLRSEGTTSALGCLFGSTWLALACMPMEILRQAID
jgi:hypothetical protein